MRSGALQLCCLPSRVEFVQEKPWVIAFSCLLNEVFPLQMVCFLPKTSKYFVVAALHHIGNVMGV